MVTVAEIRAERERREAVAQERASKLPPGDYYASGPWLCRHGAGGVLKCETHIDAVMVIVRAPKA